MNRMELVAYWRYREAGYTAKKSLEEVRSLSVLWEKDPFKRMLKVISVLSMAYGLSMRLNYSHSFKEAQIRDNMVWVHTPWCRRRVQLPFYTALRLVRDRGFFFAKVEPVRTISRREAFNILMHGDIRKP